MSTKNEDLKIFARVSARALSVAQEKKNFKSFLSFNVSLYTFLSKRNDTMRNFLSILEYSGLLFCRKLVWASPWAQSVRWGTRGSVGQDVILGAGRRGHGGQVGVGGV